MNKVEYLEALKSVLKDTDHSIMEEILADYEEHFQAGIENGKTEEEICNDLGSIEDLVEEIKEVYQTGSSNNSSRKKDKADGENDNKKGFKYWSFNFDSIDGEKIGNAINSAFESAGEAISNIDVKEIGNTLKNTFDQAASSFSQFTDSLKNQAGNPFSDYARRYDKNAESTNENCEKSFSSEDPDTKKSKDTNADVQTVSFDAEGNREDIDTAKVDENVNVDSVNSQEPETQAVEDGANTVPNDELVTPEPEEPVVGE